MSHTISKRLGVYPINKPINNLDYIYLATNIFKTIYKFILKLTSFLFSQISIYHLDFELQQTIFFNFIITYTIF